MQIKHLTKEHEGKVLYDANEWWLKPIALKIIEVFTNEKNGENFRVDISIENRSPQPYYRSSDLDIDVFTSVEEAQKRLDERYHEYLGFLSTPKGFIDFLIHETIIPVQQASDMDYIGNCQMNNLKEKALESAYFTLFKETLTINLSDSK